MKTKANDRQVGGTHYQTGGVQHWDWCLAADLDYFQGNITKLVGRWKRKNGMEDLYKAQHYLEKYIEEQERKLRATKEECKVFDTSDPLRGPIDEGTSPGNGYVDQDRVGKGVAR